MNAPPEKLLLERYRRLVDLARDLASTLDLAALLNQISQAAADLCAAEAASILLYDVVKKELFFDASSNLSEPMMRRLVVPVEESLAGWMVLNREPVIINDAQHDERLFESVDLITHITTRSLLGAPLINNNQVVGVLEAINKKDGGFSLEDQDLLMALGAQAAVAIENARLFQQSDLISDLVHELRTPLTSLNTAASLLLKPQITEAMRANLVQIMLSETGRLNEMTTNFLDLARLESGRTLVEMQPVDIGKLLHECTSLMSAKAKEQRLDLTLMIPPDLPPVQGDVAKLKQVVINLLSNAIKYNHPGGSIQVEAGVAGGELRLRVRDTGGGIPPESLAHIFERFYRVPGSEREVQGTGLGLSICKRIVDAHHGSIEVSSAVGAGTEFVVVLPLSGAQPGG